MYVVGLAVIGDAQPFGVLSSYPFHQETEQENPAEVAKRQGDVGEKGTAIGMNKHEGKEKVRGTSQGRRLDLL